MSFQFGFSSQDFSDDELESSQKASLLAPDMNNDLKCESISPLDLPHLTSPELKQPKWESLSGILEGLVNVRVSFEKILTPQMGIPLYRRELFDVKHQLMTEADEMADDGANAELEILMGETNEDVRKNIYEGGLKSWECSIDLVDALSSSLSDTIRSGTILELGCGTSLPSEFLFSQLLKGEHQTCSANIILTDYNESVLRLVSLPNLVITWALETLKTQELIDIQQCGDKTVPVEENELLLTSSLLEKFQDDTSKRGINLKLLSGTWGRQFYDIVSSELQQSAELLILSSETIYQPETLPVISELILELLRPSCQSQSYTAKALVAAKDIYFGVGGSVIEFQNYIENRIAKDSLNLVHQTFKVQAGLKRSIVSIEHRKDEAIHM
ncbi:LANO_0H07228g1_1 [Lachancea nothofagi CBS 11611]|uniref:protein-histidine N-methyltransferase n=1 Tax=Lachancea nothofagi CBS 11611 TaxID=1266666 RepID=A0A1G4KLR7_9SACH|nr:LANO_0H07228g1_1 [Lachancea nothofagi CBS 11611]